MVCFHFRSGDFLAGAQHNAAMQVLQLSGVQGLCHVGVFTRVHSKGPMLLLPCQQSACQYPINQAHLGVYSVKDFTSSKIQVHHVLRRPLLLIRPKSLQQHLSSCFNPAAISGSCADAVPVGGMTDPGVCTAGFLLAWCGQKSPPHATCHSWGQSDWGVWTAWDGPTALGGRSAAGA